MMSSWPWTTRLSAITGRAPGPAAPFVELREQDRPAQRLVRVVAGRAAVVAEDAHDLVLVGGAGAGVLRARR